VREDTGTDANFNELLDRLHAAKLDEVRQRDLLLPKIFVYQPEGLARFIVEHERLGFDALARRTAGACPWMQRRNDEA
jgi:hypothetical protein